MSRERSELRGPKLNICLASFCSAQLWEQDSQATEGVDREGEGEEEEGKGEEGEVEESPQGQTRTPNPSEAG